MWLRSSTSKTTRSSAISWGKWGDPGLITLVIGSYREIWTRILPGGWENSGRFCSLTPRTREKSRYLVNRNSEWFQVVCTHGIVAAEHKSAGSSNSVWFVSPTWPISTPRASLDWGREELWGTLKQSVVKCLPIGLREEQSKASLTGAFMLTRELGRRRKVHIANFWW